MDLVVIFLNFLFSFMVGFCGGTIAYEILSKQNKAYQIEYNNEQKDIKRVAPKNISRIADPLGEYNRYKDEQSKLYRPIKREVVNRLEIGDDNDSK